MSRGDGRAKRILILVENLSVPFDRRVWQESRALVDAGYEVDVICPMGTKRDTERHTKIEGVRIHRYPLVAATGGPAGYVREYGLALWHTFRIAMRIGFRRRFDAVHACNPPDILFLPVVWMKARRTRFVFDHHDLVPELFQSRFGEGKRWLLAGSRWAERMTFFLADGVISTNESYRRAAIDRGGMNPDDVQVVRSAPDLRRFDAAVPNPARKRGKPLMAAYLGVMAPQDGVDYALRALATLRAERDDFHAVFVGGGDALDDLRILSADLGLDDCVEFTGRVSDEELAEVLATADVGLAPDPLNPLNDVSTMNKIMEYMALEVPIVSFDLVEARVSAGDAAVYATPNDEAEFAALLGSLFDDPGRRAEMVQIGLARVSGELSWDVSATNLVGFYDRLLGVER